jgi:hypothetical protein
MDVFDVLWLSKAGESSLEDRMYADECRSSMFTCVRLSVDVRCQHWPVHEGVTG